MHGRELRRRRVDDLVLPFSMAYTHVGSLSQPTACNYNPLADRDPQNECVHCDSSACFGCSVDGLSCDYECDGEAGETCEEGGVCHILGCSNSDACNYDAAATMDDGSCHTCDTANCMVCDGEDSCTFACTGDEVCDGEGSCVIYGCTFAFACNYNPAATADDLSCNICAADSCLVCDGAVDPSNDNECVSSCSGDEVCHNDQCHIEGCTDVSWASLVALAPATCAIHSYHTLTSLASCSPPRATTTLLPHGTTARATFVAHALLAMGTNTRRTPLRA